MMIEASATDRYAVVNGLRLHYLEWGEPTAPPIVMLHGLRSAAPTWAAVAAPPLRPLSRAGPRPARPRRERMGGGPQLPPRRLRGGSGGARRPARAGAVHPHGSLHGGRQHARVHGPAPEPRACGDRRGYRPGHLAAQPRVWADQPRARGDPALVRLLGRGRGVCPA